MSPRLHRCPGGTRLYRCHGEGRPGCEPEHKLSSRGDHLIQCKHRKVKSYNYPKAVRLWNNPTTRLI